MSIYIKILYLLILYKMKYGNLLIFLMIKPFLCDVVYQSVQGFSYKMNDLPAIFGPRLSFLGLKGNIVISNPINGCTIPVISNFNSNRFFLMERGICDFDVKVRNAQNAGALGAIIFNNRPDEPLIEMYGNYTQDIIIPSVFINNNDGNIIIDYHNRSDIVIINGINIFNLFGINFNLFVIISFSVLMLFGISTCTFRSTRYRNSHIVNNISKMTKKQMKKLKKIKFRNEDSDKYQTCAICLEDYKENEELRILPCEHEYHKNCIDEWLVKNNSSCPKCRQGANDSLDVPLINQPSNLEV